MLRAVLAIVLLLLPAAAQAGGEPSELFAAHCARCHGAERYGGDAPPLLPESLGRKSDSALVQAILGGKANTQMPPFGALLSEADADALVAWIRRPAGEVRWGMAEIAASRRTLEPDGPALAATIDRGNLTLVVERDAGTVAVLDGDTLDELDRFAVGRVHGGPKFDAALRRVWAVTRDGVVVAYDLDRGGVTARVLAGVNTRNIAVNPAGTLVATAAQLPAHVALLDGDLNPRAIVPLEGQPSGIYQVPGEDRFVLTLRDVPTLLLIDQATFAVERRDLPEAFEDFVFVPGRRQLLASSRNGSRILLYDLDTSAVVATLETQALPHLFSACFFEREGALYAALNHIGVPRLTVVTVDDLAVQADVALAGSGYFARTHPGTPWLWVDTNTERIELVDKATLTLRPQGLVPEAGKKAMHVEFTADGGLALVSVWHHDGAVVAYDSTSLQEKRRLPFSMPIGKYNATNKAITLRSAR